MSPLDPLDVPLVDPPAASSQAVARPAPTVVEDDFLARLVVPHARRLGRAWPLLLLGLLLGAAAGIAWRVTHPTWVARCTVLLVQSLTAQAQTEELLGSGPRPNQAYAAAILESNTTAADVISSLSLGDRYTPAKLATSLTVTPTKEGVLSLAYTDRDPQQAVEILRAYLTAYRRYTDSTVLTVAKNERVFIQKQLATSDANLKQLEKRLLEYKERHLAFGQEDSFRALLARSYADVGAARVALQQAQSKRDSLRDAYRQSSAAMRRDQDAPSLLADPSVSALQAELVKARSDLANLRVYLKDTMPEVKVQKEKVDNLEAQLNSRLHELARAIDSGMTPALVDADAEVSVARARLKGAQALDQQLRGRLRKMPEEELELSRIKRGLDIEDARNRTLHTSLQAALLQEAREPIYLVVLDAPVVAPRMSALMRYSLYGGAGGLAGMGLCALLVLLRRPRK
jgi:uncharacterized protein involved in exopolysaccharide biosynthesis